MQIFPSDPFSEPGTTVGNNTSYEEPFYAFFGFLFLFFSYLKNDLLRGSMNVAYCSCPSVGMGK